MHTAHKATMVITLFYAAGALAADARLVWQIGQQDHDFRDLANPGGLTEYKQAFPEDVSFVVGKSEPLKHFSAIHPGPLDPWAGRGEHPFIITFEMESAPTGIYELRVDLVDTHNISPPMLRVSVNGKSADLALKHGTGDLAMLHPEKGKARSLGFFFGADLLKQGTNRIELRCLKGSWLLYDALSLRELPAGTVPAVNVEAEQTIFFVEKQDRLKQEFTISVTGLLTDDQVNADVYAGADKLESLTLGKPSLGIISPEAIHIESTDRPRELTIRVSAGNQIGTVSVTQKPTKKWRIYAVPSTHTDIGYTDIQDRVVLMHNRNTNLALQLIKDFPLYHWNLESSWAAQVWLRDVPAYRCQELYDTARQKRLGIESGYLNMLTGLCSDEELIRNLYYSARLHRMYGVPFESHTITDAPSHVWTVPSILAGAGIRCVSIGINGIRAPVLKQNIHHKSPFWWEGPDGKKVLTWFSAGYNQAKNIGLKEGYERMRAMVGSHLYWWDHRDDYPYDAILLHGAYSDNAQIGGDIAESLTEYDKHYAYPKVILCANNDFFEYIEKNFADKIPTVRGCGGSWWEDGAASSAVETAINRVAHQDVIAAETVWATAGMDETSAFPQDQFDTIWDNILLYDEHTWGAHNSISEPTRDFVTRQWAVKASYATTAADRTGRLLARGLELLASQVSAPEESLLVFNSTGQARTGVVQAEVPQDAVIMDADKVVPQQVVYSDPALKSVTVAFLANEVPSVGYRIFHLDPAKQSLSNAQGPERFTGTVLENDFYRVVFDSATGGINSLVDKKLGTELVNQTSAYKLGQLIYAAGGGFKKNYAYWGPNLSEIKRHSPTEAKIEPGARGPLFSSAKSAGRMEMFDRLEMEVILYEHDRRVDFVFRLNKKATFDKEALYIAFPFAGAKPEFRYEIGGGNVRPNQDHFPGACRDWFAVQRWVTLNTEDAAVALSPVDTPLISLCDMNAGKWLVDELPITNGTIFAYALNNYWFTNYKAGQDGDFIFRYSITSDKSIDPSSASVFGESVVNPMRAIRVHPGERTPTLPPDKSFCGLEPENVMLTACKRADDGRGLIVRVRETAGQATDAKITVGFDWVKKASRCDLVERIQGPLNFTNGSVLFNIGANAMATVRLE